MYALRISLQDSWDNVATKKPSRYPGSGQDDQELSYSTVFTSWMAEGHITVIIVFFFANKIHFLATFVAFSPVPMSLRIE